MKGSFGMCWWKKLIFSITSLVWGYVSLDYLYYAFSKLTNAKGRAGYYKPESDGLFQVLGLFMFILWFFINALYCWVIRKSSPQIDMVEKDYKTGRQKVKKKWFDIILQAAFIITGIILRWAYIICIYLPKA